MSRFRLVKSHPRLGVLFRPWLVSNAYETLAFLRKHRRIPRFAKTGYLNDLLFKIRAKETNYVFRSFSSDKEFSKILIRGLEGEALSVPTLAVLRSPDEIDGFRFPDHCVIKPTHMSGEVIYHTTGDVTLAEQDRMRRWFDFNFGDMTGERHYQRLEPKIIVEPWLKLNGDFCHDYRFFLFEGDLMLIEAKMRLSESDHCHILFTPDWERFPGKVTYNKVTYDSRRTDISVPKPDCLPRMIDISKNVAQYLDFVRVDFYTDCKEVLFVGEISHVNGNVRQSFDPVLAERLFTRATMD